jgi:hypothetical protein
MQHAMRDKSIQNITTKEREDLAGLGADGRIILK